MRHARILALLAVGGGILLAIVYRRVIDPAAIQHALARAPLAPLLFIALQLVASLLFVPRLVLGIAAGLVFGFVWGAVWALAGAMAGAAAGFALVRWFGATGILDTSPGIGRLVARAERGGWRAVAMLRLMPLPHSAVNTLLAMTRVDWISYLAGSFLGMLPMTLAQADIGASGNSLLQGGRWPLACLMLAAGLGATFLIGRSLKGSQSPPGTLD